MENIKNAVKNNIKSFHNYDTTKVNLDTYDGEKDYENVFEINSDSYDDGEIVFIDCNIEEN